MIAKLKHFSPKETKNNKSLWHVIDATDKTLGRLATEISVILMGKNKVDYIPHQMSGDFVVIINASNVKVTGKKLQQKTYISHSTRPGSTKEKKVDVRVIATSNRNIFSEIKEGNFREDLFYRLNVFPLKVPALRNRTGDVPLLVEHFISKFQKNHQLYPRHPKSLAILEHPYYLFLYLLFSFYFRKED